jgi:hypothetical protein
VSTRLIFTDHWVYGVSVAARSMATALSRIVAVPGAVETLALGSAALGVEDKVADQPQEIQAVSVPVCQCHLETIVVHFRYAPRHRGRGWPCPEAPVHVAPLVG